ncbi:ABC-type amino acid transport substrate-binding protein [Paucibacter oligotrophus]|uniref:ABC-type amino acid transport substrate-binding protein n=1 Tax=Roseateles oligotrophus TaxID=1769250 RepID=A0A840LAE4_9BURK|nr:ABC transporter substrate-binding protein [Roseateles oligotrophus]MBB4843099.1 ABC-type amino acid transport substrate-binding protein [Roseateles oligotrophus]
MTRILDKIRVAGRKALGLGMVFLSLSAAAGTTGAASAATASVLERVQRSGILRVCIWPDYYGVTFRNPRSDQLGGIDIELSAEFARDLKVQLQYVETSFPQLVEDVKAERCDVAMFAVGVLPQRKEHLNFSQPYLRSDIYGVTTRASRMVREWSDIDKPGVVVGVQAGTFMEPVMGQALKNAKMVIVRPPASREAELESGRVDVFMTDYPYSRRLLDKADWARLISPPSPFFTLPYAYAVKQGDAVWLARVDEFVAAIKRDGRLKAAAKRNGLTEILVN